MTTTIDDIRRDLRAAIVEADYGLAAEKAGQAVHFRKCQHRRFVQADHHGYQCWDAIAVERALLDAVDRLSTDQMAAFAYEKWEE